jgi:hypothetical protein
VATFAVVLVVLGGLAYAAVRLFGAVAGTADVLDDKVPARTLFYATAYLDPGAGQKINLENLARKFPALEGRDLGQTLQQGLDALSAQGGLSFSRDIQPWLGTQMAVAFEPPTGPEPGFAFLIDSDNDARARAGLARAEGSQAFGEGATWKSQPYRGVQVRVGEIAPGVGTRAYAILDNTVIVSTEADVIHEVIDTMQGRSPNLADQRTYRDTVDDLPDSVLGLAYLNFPQAMNLFGTGSAFNLSEPQISNPFAQLRAFQGLGFSLSAQPAGLELDFAVDLDLSQLTPEQRAALGGGKQPKEVLSSVPRRAFGVLAIGNFKDAVQGVIGQARQNPLVGGFIRKLGLDQVVAGLSGDAALEVGPGTTSPVGGALLVGTDDPSGMQRFLDRGARQIVSSSSSGAAVSFRTEQYKGVTIRFASGGALGEARITPAYAVANGFGVIATSPEEVKAVIDAHGGPNITTAPIFRDARDQVPGDTQLLYVDTQAILQRFAPQLSSSLGGTFTSVVEPNLRPIKALILTSGQSGDAVVSRLFLLIR